MSNMASRLLVISKAVSLIEPPIRSDIELINSAYATRLDIRTILVTNVM